MCVDHLHANEDNLNFKQKQQLRRSNIRGLLCDDCNIALGKLKENHDTLINIMNYLKNPPAKRILK